MVTATVGGSLIVYVADQFFGNWMTGVAGPAIARWFLRWERAPTGLTLIWLFVVILFWAAWAALDPSRLLNRRSKVIAKELAARTVELSQARTEAEDWKRNAIERWWLTTFGMQQPQISGPYEAEARKEIEKFRPQLVAIRDLVWPLLNALATHHKNNAGDFHDCAFDLFNEKIAQTFRAVVQVMDHATDDLRVYLFAFDCKYNELRRWLLWLEEGTHGAIKLNELPEYDAYWDADTDYFKHLKGLMEISEFSELRRSLSVHRNSNSYQVSLPPRRLAAVGEFADRLRPPINETPGRPVLSSEVLDGQESVS